MGSSASSSSSSSASATSVASRPTPEAYHGLVLVADCKTPSTRHGKQIDVCIEAHQDRLNDAVSAWRQVILERRRPADKRVLELLELGSYDWLQMQAVIRRFMARIVSAGGGLHATATIGPHEYLVVYSFGLEQGRKSAAAVDEVRLLCRKDLIVQTARCSGLLPAPAVSLVDD